MPALREVFAEFDVRFDPRRQLQRGNQQVGLVKRSLERLKPALSELTSGFVRFATAIGGAVMIRAMGRFVAGTIRMGDDLDKTAQQLGLTVRELQAFQHAAALGGVDAAAFANSMGQLQRNAEAASRGGGESAEMFERLGVSVRDSNGDLRTGSELLIAVSRGLSGMSNSTERVAISSTLMGRSGRRLLPMMESIANGTGDIERELDALGGGMSDLAIQRSVELTDNLARLKMSFTSLRSVVAVQIIPAINKAVKWFTKFSVAVGRTVSHSHILETTLAAITIGVVLATAALVAMSPAVGVVIAVAVSLGLLAVAVDDVWVGMEGGQSVSRDFLTMLGDMIGVGNLGILVFDGLAISLRRVGDYLAEAAAQTFLGHDAMSPWLTFVEILQTASRELSHIYAIISGLTGVELPGFVSQARFGGGAEQALVQRGLGQSVRDSVGSYLPTSVRDMLGLGGTRRAAADDARSRSLSAAAFRVQAPGAFTPVAPVTQNVEAPMTVNVTANEATDAQEVGRIVATKLRVEQARQNRELAAALVPAGATANGGAA